MTELTALKATPQRLRRLAQLGYLDRQALVAGLHRLQALPDRHAWLRFLDYILLVLGALFLTSGIFFFVAYNWEELPRMARFGTVGGALLIAVAVAHGAGLQRLAGKVALTVAALLVGALLAVFGQEYQSGADSYSLFAYWALLITGWVLIGRFDLLWVGWLALLNVTLLLFWQQTFRGDTVPHAESLFALNVVGLLLWEWMEGRFPWWRHRWPARITLTAAFGFILWPTLWNIFALFDSYPSYQEAVPLVHRFAPLIYLLWLAAVWLVYSRYRPDLFMITVALFSLIVVLTSLLGRALVEVDETLAYFVTSAAVIAQAGVAVTLLRRLHVRWEEQGLGE
ncbi:MAG: DUF2157 domain-containing protein [Caldilineaceae bacterium]|nr:DUF2157 domain-containing protein [Caldilineaceae bacterium]MCB0124573.1 DUF2157 domain-containing protein [Caldilineaceae bacterium]